MSNKKPISDLTVNKQEISSVFIDTDNEIIVVDVKMFLEQADTPTVGTTRISNISIVKKTLMFSEVPNINGLITSIDAQI